MLKILIEELAVVHKSSPCIFLGDFNAIRTPFDKVGGNPNWSSSKNEFHLCVNLAELDDLSCGGCQFTWANNQGNGNYIASKIDHEGFLPLVHKVWCKYIKGSPMFRVCCKLRALKPKFKALNKKHFSDVSVRASIAKEELDGVQLKLCYRSN